MTNDDNSRIDGENDEAGEESQKKKKKRRKNKKKKKKGAKVEGPDAGPGTGNGGTIEGGEDTHDRAS
jgi:hypothetical protein